MKTDIHWIISLLSLVIIAVTFCLALLLTLKEGDERFELIKEKTIRFTFIGYLGFSFYEASKEVYQIWNHIPQQTTTAPYFTNLGVLSIIFLVCYFFNKRKYS